VCGVGQRLAFAFSLFGPYFLTSLFTLELVLWRLALAVRVRCATLWDGGEESDLNLRALVQIRPNTQTEYSDRQALRGYTKLTVTAQKIATLILLLILF
jgi:hypothetical protein